MKKWPFIVAVAMLLSTWGIERSLSHGESVLAKKPFADFPLTLAGEWQGKELGMDQKILDVLKLTDYMMRVYVSTGQAMGNGQEVMGKARSEGREARGSDPHPSPLPSPVALDGATGPRERGGRGEPVWLYVGYYQSQRTGSTYHSPKNCLPGAGWQLGDTEPITVPVRGAGGITMNKVLIQKGLDKQVILYWYQDRGRAIASEYWAKAYLIWDAMTKNRTDGALVRISVPVTTTPEAAYQHGLAFLHDLWPMLQEYLPSPP